MVALFGHPARLWMCVTGQAIVAVSWHCSCHHHSSSWCLSAVQALQLSWVRLARFLSFYSESSTCALLNKKQTKIELYRLLIYTWFCLFKIVCIVFFISNHNSDPKWPLEPECSSSAATVQEKSKDTKYTFGSWIVAATYLLAKVL